MRQRIDWLSPGPIVAAVMLLLAIASCPALSRTSRGTRPLEDQAWQPPPFDSLAAGVRREVERYSDRAEYESARLDPHFALRRWRYRSDSLSVVALFARSTDAGSRVAAASGAAARWSATRRAPAVVYCRGSYLAQGQMAMFVPVLHRFTSAGFVVVAPQYRGSEGGEGRDEMGGADLEDVMAAIRLAAHAPGVDPRSIYLYGESRGGMMALQAMRDRAAVRAAATVGAFTDLDTLFRDDLRSAAMAEKIWPDYRERSAAIAERRSALRWADRLHVPLLILQGREDGQVRVWHGERLAAALLARRTPCELHILDGAGHTIGERSIERDSMIVAWFLGHRH